jgi:hypothetical protein
MLHYDSVVQLQPIAILAFPRAFKGCRAGAAVAVLHADTCLSRTAANWFGHRIIRQDVYALILYLLCQTCLYCKLRSCWASGRTASKATQFRNNSYLIDGQPAAPELHLFSAPLQLIAVACTANPPGLSRANPLTLVDVCSFYTKLLPVPPCTTLHTTTDS